MAVRLVSSETLNAAFTRMQQRPQWPCWGHVFLIIRRFVLLEDDDGRKAHRQSRKHDYDEFSAFNMQNKLFVVVTENIQIKINNKV